MAEEKILMSEILTEEELHNVSGNGIIETALDSMLLYDAGACSRKYTAAQLTKDWVEGSNSVDKGWNKFGVECITHVFSDNEYKINGKTVSRRDARDHVLDNCGKKLNHNNYIHGGNAGYPHLI